jgi:hypothetical protein
MLDDCQRIREQVSRVVDSLRVSSPEGYVPSLVGSIILLRFRTCRLPASAVHFASNKRVATGRSNVTYVTAILLNF